MTEVFTVENTCDKYKLFIPAHNYTTPQHLAEEMQSAIYAFEGSVLRQTDAYIHVSCSDTKSNLILNL